MASDYVKRASLAALKRGGGGGAGAIERADQSGRLLLYQYKETTIFTGKFRVWILKVAVGVGMVAVVVPISLALYLPDWLSSNGPPCTVDITPAPETMPETMNFGQFAQFTANVTGGGRPVTYQWSVDGAILKDYSEIAYLPDKPNPRWSTTPMGPSDFRNQDIAFYWKPPADSRPVSVEATLVDGKTCNATRNINVERDTTDPTKQAEDYYTSNHNERVLDEHDQWHLDNDFKTAQAGAEFFDFHRRFLDRFNSWRSEFGYLPVKEWDPGTKLPEGFDIEHKLRDGDYNPATHGKPKWFTITGGPEARDSNPWPCDEQAGQTELADFPADQKLLGCATEAPWHNEVHNAIGGDMGDTSTAPKDPIFWRWHKFLDTVSRERIGLDAR